MKVLIATPTVQGSVASAYSMTVLGTTQVLNAIGAGYDLMTVDNAGLVTARTALAHAFLADDEATHLLFLDSDMSVRPEVIARLLGLRAPIAAAACPEPRIDLAAFAEAMAETGDFERARAVASRFAVGIAPGRIDIVDGIVEVERIGFGCVLIEKPLLRRLADAGLAPPLDPARLRGLGLCGTVHDFFGGEDIRGGRGADEHAFCDRVRALGDTPILAYVGPGAGRVGTFTYDATCFAWLQNIAGAG